MHRWVAAGMLFVSSPAWAFKLCAIDFQKAMADTAEGKSAKAKIDTMYASRKAELDRMEKDLTKAIADYQGRQLILSPEARGQEEQKLGLQQRNFEQTYMTYQGEMEQTSMGLLGDLGEKMKAVAQVVGKDNACSAIIDKAIVVYAGADLADVTASLVTKYNAQHPSK